MGKKKVGRGGATRGGVRGGWGERRINEGFRIISEKPWLKGRSVELASRMKECLGRGHRSSPPGRVKERRWVKVPSKDLGS